MSGFLNFVTPITHGSHILSQTYVDIGINGRIQAVPDWFEIAIRMSNLDQEPCSTFNISAKFEGWNRASQLAFFTAVLFAAAVTVPSLTRGAGC